MKEHNSQHFKSGLHHVTWRGRIVCFFILKTQGEPQSSDARAIRKRSQETTYPRSLADLKYDGLWQGPSFPLRRVPEPTPEPPQRHPPTNKQRHKLPKLAILHNIVYNRQRRIRHICTHRMLRDGLHLKPDIVPTKIERLGRATGRLRSQFHHFFQHVEEEELAFDTGASPLSDFLEPKIAVIMKSSDGFDVHFERFAWPSFS